MRYDIAVIGAGPAGLSAALNAAVRRKQVLLVGSAESSNKVLKAEVIDNYLGMPNVSGEEMAQAFLSHVKKFEEFIDIKKDHVDDVYAMGDYFALNCREHQMIEATAVILATGVGVSKMIPGEEAYLGKGVGYCATCDAALYKDKEVVVVGMNHEAIEDTNFIAEYASKTTFINRTGQDVVLNDGIEVIKAQPKAIEGDSHARTLVLNTGRIDADGIFIIRDAKNADQLVPGLATEGAHVPVNRSMETNIAGMYAVGDLTGAPYQISKAVGEGHVAALAAAKYVSAQGRK